MTKSYTLKCTNAFEAAEPLYKRVPTRDANGRLLNDLMMIIPGLKRQPAHLQRNILDKIEQALRHYQNHIVFAELNMQLGTLWLSVNPAPGLGAEIAALLHHLLPEARLVAQRLPG